jgi:hypothetical protein
MERDRARQAYLKVQSARWDMQQSYEQYVQAELERHIEEIGPGEFGSLVRKELIGVKKEYPLMTAEQLEILATQRVRRDLRESIPLPSFEQFSKNPQESLF